MLGNAQSGFPDLITSSLFFPTDMKIKKDIKDLKPVNVSEDQIIRQKVGLRPYRKSGYRLEKQVIADKQIIHNYGHGGGGISLSWGTASMATDLVDAQDTTSIAVLGCGIIGLSTAIILQQKGYEVTIYTKELPADTTSNAAGALWAPFSVYDSESVSAGFEEQFDKASEISLKMFSELVGEKYGIWWAPTYFLGGGFDFPGGEKLYPGYKTHGPENGAFDYSLVQEVSALMIEPPIYLHALLDDYYRAGGEIEIKNFQDPQGLLALKENVLMNCTGLGSKQLFSDDELMPIRGQLAMIPAQPEIDYMYLVESLDNLLYMFPRKDGIILGGTYEKGNGSLKINEDENARIIAGHKTISDYLSRKK